MEKQPVKVEVNVTIAPAFLELMLAAAQQVLSDTSKMIPLEEAPEFVAFFSMEKPQSYFYDVTPHLDMTEGGIYVDYAPRAMKNPMSRFAMH